MRENVVKYDIGFFSKYWKSNFRKYFDKFIQEKLYDVYNPLGKWGYVYDDPAFNFYKRQGVVHTKYDLSHLKLTPIAKKYVMEVLKGKDSERSILNYLNTNIRAITEILNWMNENIVSGKIKDYTQIDFYIGNWDLEIKKFYAIFEENKRTILTSGSDIFDRIMSAMIYTSQKGGMCERETISRLSKFDGITNLLQSEQGDKKDMTDGIDVMFDYKGKTKTVQCKSYVGIIDDGVNYVITTKSFSKKYDKNKVNLLSFCNTDKGFYVFTNDDSIKVQGSTYIIPKKLKRDV